MIVFLPRDAARVLSKMDIENGEERLANFIIRLVNRVAMQGRYVLLIQCAGADELVCNRQRLAWLYHTLNKLQRLPHRKYLHRLLVVHPSNLASSALWAFSTCLSRKLWAKLVFVRRLVDLLPHVGHGDNEACFWICFAVWIFWLTF